MCCLGNSKRLIYIRKLRLNIVLNLSGIQRNSIYWQIYIQSWKSLKIPCKILFHDNLAPIPSGETIPKHVKYYYSP